jgi:hypothetical protein
MSRRGVSRPAISMSQISFSSSTDDDKSIEAVPTEAPGPQLLAADSSDPEPVTPVKCEPESPPPQPAVVAPPQPAVVAPPQPAVVAPPPVSDALAMYSIVWSTGRLSRQKTNIRMCERDRLVFSAAKTSDKWVISEGVGPNACGRLHNHARRFWMRNDQTELFGLHFYNVNGRLNAPRAFHLALPIATPYAAETRDAELSRIAKAAVNTKGVKLFATKQPTVRPNGAIILNFGNGFVITSIKNFIIEDESGQTVFLIYKSSGSTCTIKVKLPVTPLVAFGMAIAIITSIR